MPVSERLCQYAFMSRIVLEWLSLDRAVLAGVDDRFQMHPIAAASSLIWDGSRSRGRAMPRIEPTWIFSDGADQSFLGRWIRLFSRTVR